MFWVANFFSTSVCYFVSYGSSFFVKSLKTPFTINLVCMQTDFFFLPFDLRELRCGHPCSG